MAECVAIDQVVAVGIADRHIVGDVAILILIINRYLVNLEVFARPLAAQFLVAERRAVVERVEIEQ